MLITIGIEDEDQLFPFALASVDGENKDKWRGLWLPSLKVTDRNDISTIPD